MAGVLTVALATTAVIGQGDDRESDRQQPEQVYGVVLSPVNDSGVEGTATLMVMEDGELRASLTATGLEEWRIHQQHIHGNPDGAAAECPTDALDEDDDGIVSLEEALPAVGPVVMPLVQQPFPVAGDDGAVVFRETYELETDIDRTPTADRTPTDQTPTGDRTPADRTPTGDRTPTTDQTPTDRTPTTDRTPDDTGTPEATPTPVEMPLDDLTDGVVVVHGLTVDGEYEAGAPVACGEIQVCPIDATPTADGTPTADVTPDDTPTPRTTDDGTPTTQRTPTTGTTVNIPPACPEDFGTPTPDDADSTPVGTVTPAETPTPTDDD